MASRSDTESRLRLWLLIGTEGGAQQTHQQEVPNRGEVLVTPGARQVARLCSATQQRHEVHNGCGCGISQFWAFARGAAHAASIA